jgi:hypothetical protein
LSRLARREEKALGELLRELAEKLLKEEERRAWEAEARRQAEAYAAQAEVPGTPAARAEEEWEEFWLPMNGEALDDDPGDTG